MRCQRCKSERVAYYNAKTSDRNYLSIGSVHLWGYMPKDMGIGNEDYVTFEYCLSCGQIRGNWPLPETQLEEHDTPQPVMSPVFAPMIELIKQQQDRDKKENIDD